MIIISKEYFNITKLAIDIYIGYQIYYFSIEKNYICRKLNKKLINWSEIVAYISNIFNKTFYRLRILENFNIIFGSNQIANKQENIVSFSFDIIHILNKMKKGTKVIKYLIIYFISFLLFSIPILINYGIGNIYEIINISSLNKKTIKEALTITRIRSKYCENQFFNYKEELYELTKNNSM